MTNFAALRLKTYSCLIDDCHKNKKSKGTKKCIIKIKLKFEDYKHCLEATHAHVKNRITHVEKNKLDVASLQENHKEFIKNNKLMLKLH